MSDLSEEKNDARNAKEDQCGCYPMVHRLAPTAVL